jgi:hypothetical protein
VPELEALDAVAEQSAEGVEGSDGAAATTDAATTPADAAASDDPKASASEDQPGT